MFSYSNTQPPPPPSQFHQPCAYFANPQNYQEYVWYLDSGVNHHVTPDSLNLLTSTPSINEFDQLFVGNGQGTRILTQGSSIFCNKSSKINFLLTKLLQVPQITQNLLSASQFPLDNHIYFEFWPYDCIMHDQDY